MVGVNNFNLFSRILRWICFVFIWLGFCFHIVDGRMMAKVGAIVYKVAPCTMTVRQVLASPRPVPILPLQTFRPPTEDLSVGSNHRQRSGLLGWPKMEGNFLITGAAQGFGKEFTRRVLKSKFFGLFSHPHLNIHKIWQYYASPKTVRY